MKIVFSTKNVKRASFLDTCRYAYDYGFSGFEIYDAVKERIGHHDSILRRDRVSDAKRKLLNRNLSVSALRMTKPVEDEETTPELIRKYVAMAAASGIESVIVRVEKETDLATLDEKLVDAIGYAETADVKVLFETVGYLANTENVIDLINHFASSAVGASWNVRGTYFDAGETAETTIKNLGAYIKYVRLGDMKDGRTVLIGEGDLDVEKIINALSSLNYEGLTAMKNPLIMLITTVIRPAPLSGKNTMLLMPPSPMFLIQWQKLIRISTPSNIRLSTIPEPMSSSAVMLMNVQQLLFPSA